MQKNRAKSSRWSKLEFPCFHKVCLHGSNMKDKPSILLIFPINITNVALSNSEPVYYHLSKMSNKRSPLQKCYGCSVGIRTTVRARPLSSPSVVQAYQASTGDLSAIPQDKVMS